MKSAKQAINPTDPMFAGADGKSIFDRFEYSAAVKAGGLVFVAGQVGLDPDGSIPAELEAQFVNAFERLKVVLESAGSSLDNLVELVTYHVDLPTGLRAFMEIKQRYVKAPFPTWSIIGVAALARPELKIEIKAVATARE
jgi:enamine deaminase RidA (YjgF/YER057c/UK114 family)